MVCVGPQAMIPHISPAHNCFTRSIAEHTNYTTKCASSKVIARVELNLALRLHLPHCALHLIRHLVCHVVELRYRDKEIRVARRLSAQVVCTG
jgi:hypothetical protein